MAEDLELNALFELSQPITRLPRTGELTRMDDFFESCDYGIESASLQRDEDMTEIFISSGRVVRKYRA